MHIVLVSNAPSKSLFVHVQIIIEIEYFILYYDIHTTLTLHNDIHSAIPGNSMDCVVGYTGVYSCCTPLDVHDYEDPLITDHNSLRTEPLYTGMKFYTIQVQCISFIDSGHPSDYWRP